MMPFQRALLSARSHSADEGANQAASEWPGETVSHSAALGSREESLRYGHVSYSHSTCVTNITCCQHRSTCSSGRGWEAHRQKGVNLKDQFRALSACSRDRKQAQKEKGCVQGQSKVFVKGRLCGARIQCSPES